MANIISKKNGIGFARLFGRTNTVFYLREK